LFLFNKQKENKMFYIYTPNPETRKSWRSALEVQAAAIQHEKRRLQREDVAPLAKPQKATR
jgi:hypothetical protein